MNDSIHKLCRASRRRLQHVIRKSKDAELVRRASALLHLHFTSCVAQTAEHIAAARSTVYRWIGWFEADDINGLCSDRRGRPFTTVTDEVLSVLQSLLEKTPAHYGYLRTRWSSELLAIEVRTQTGGSLHASTVRRLLPLVGFRYRRARPFLFRRDPQKSPKLRRINNALALNERGVAVLYVDEADVNLNPKIGFGWRAVGKQELVPTPGQNVKRYVAGALHAHTGKIICVEAARKNSELFISLLHSIRRTYRAMRRIIVVLDNNNIHSSRKTDSFLRANPKFELIFQPVYHPWVNRIERLWKALHDTVTRNHRYRTLEELMFAVRRFLKVAEPFPGSGHGIAMLVA
jgi:transposase